MSGTSLDGIDVAVVDIQGKQIRTVAFQTVPYKKALRQRILAASNTTTTTGEISRLNSALGEAYAKAVANVCRKSRVPATSLQLIGCHGQTVYHESGRNTLQLGEADVLAAKLKCPVVSDFRKKDIAAGGKGAPLVPFVDKMCFSSAKNVRVACNLGGIANITVLHPDGRVTAFDTGPGNMVIDALTQEFTHGRKLFDRGGRLAKRGVVDRRLLAELMRDPYYRQKPPKTAGREQYGKEFADRMKASGTGMLDLITTATLLTSSTVALAVRTFAPEASELIVSGGGVHNPELMGHIAALLPDVRIARSSDYGLDVDAKEAIAFAILAYQTWHRKPGNVPEATGADRAVILGKVSYP
jgi:anhydro-N-acetylmuramic acid kinase